MADSGSASTGGPVTVLLVVDASNSMSEEATALALSVDVMLTAFAARGFDAVVVGLTGVAVQPSGGATDGIDPTEAGTLLGTPASGPTAAADLQTQLICSGVCWNEAMLPSDPSYECGEDAEGVVSREYLDCACGADDWQDHCAAGTEEPLEASLGALCRARPESLEACTGAGVASAPGSSVDLPLDGRQVLVAVVTDEGDSSRQLEPGAGDATLYADALQTVAPGLVFAAIGPAYDPEPGDSSCLMGATE